MIIRGLLEETSGVLDHSQDGSGHSQVRAKYLKAASPSDSHRISWPALDRDQVDPAARNSIWSCARTKWLFTSSPPLSSAVTPPTSLASQIFHPNSQSLPFSYHLATPICTGSFRKSLRAYLGRGMTWYQTTANMWPARPEQ